MISPHQLFMAARPLQHAAEMAMLFDEADIICGKEMSS